MSGQGKYKDTVNLPQTEFPMRGDLAKREPLFIEQWQQSNLYQRILDSRKDAPRFVLHDGPPYANGSIHYGHILNKLLKDLVVRSKTMAGHCVPFTPGWDTHGLPIELAVERELGPKRASMSAAEVRAACKAYAEKFVAIQRAGFERLGILGAWDAPYLTLDKEYEAAIVQALATFAEGGYLYRGQKPVYWCARDKTALAEAEIEYKDKTSPSVYVRFALADRTRGAALAAALAGKTISLPIWTTTPWTLPANLAIVLHREVAYVAVPHPRSDDEYLIVAHSLAAKFVTAIGGTPDEATWVAITPEALATLEGARYVHPFIATPANDADFRVWFADYVTTEQGTGLVHTAPGHGADDYRTGMAHGLAPYAPIDNAGRYVAGVTLAFTDHSIDLAGKSTDEANPIIVAELAASGALLNPTTDKVHHSYPHCWRCKGPILFRATPQWFLAIDHAGLREKSLAAIRSTEWVPPWGENRIYAMIENRPDWVLSRQRLWGVPIPAFYCKACGTEHASAATMAHIATIFAARGADAWWTLPPSELVPAGTTCAGCNAGPDQFEPERDIVDVWFESGVSWLAMQRKCPEQQPIDLYLEGSDQHRGWFHSSLLAGIGVAGKAPYRQVITHGFVLDDNGIPYSKSTIEKAKAEGKKTSYIDPNDVIKESGAELFRLWAASTEFRNDITYSRAILDGLIEWHRKFRVTLRFLLGNLFDFEPQKHTRANTTLLAIDRYLLARLDDVVATVTAAYDRYEFHVVHRTLVEFVTGDLSALYGDVTKDRLYADARNSPSRRAAQLVMYECARALTLLIAPIMAFTAEDLWKHLPKLAQDGDSVHLARFPQGAKLATDNSLLTDFAVLRTWRERVTKALEPFRAQKNKSVDAHVALTASSSDVEILQRHRAELPDLFIVSGVELNVGATAEVTVTAHTGKRCERCWKRFTNLAANPDDVCHRCADALSEQQRQ